MEKSKLLLVGVLFFLFAAAPAALAGDYIDPGSDYWRCTDAQINFSGACGGGECMPPLPADFFGPGSDPFDGVIALAGQPAGPAESIIQRISQGHVPPPYPSTDLIDAKMIKLDLESASLITVTYNGGLDPQEWIVSLALSTYSVPDGNLNITKVDANGGTFTVELLYVQPIFIFTQLTEPTNTIVWDTGLDGVSPLEFSTVAPHPWQHSADGNDFNPSGTGSMVLDTGGGCQLSLWMIEGGYIFPGGDIWRCTDAQIDFSGDCPIGECISSLPADFFGPGSDPFDGTVAFAGEAIGPVDTIIHRYNTVMVPPPYPSSAHISTEITQLNLNSTSPITITYNGGLDPQQWDVSLTLSTYSVSNGDANVTKEHENGGTFTMQQLYVQPIFTFTQSTDPANTVVLDTPSAGISPLEFSTIAPYPWQHSADGNDFNFSGTDGMVLHTGGDCHLLLWPVKNDTFWIMVNELGDIIDGGGSGYNDGQWYEYPHYGWKNQWFYNGPYDPNHKKEIDVFLSVRNVDYIPPSYVEIAYNWTTGAWSQLGLDRPPLPGDVPTAELENQYIRRHIFSADVNLINYLGLPGPVPYDTIYDHFEILDYNPEWISIDVRGANFDIFDVFGIEHACLPKGLEPNIPKPPTEHMKWSQPPIEIDHNMTTPIFCGWDEPSFYNQHNLSFECWSRPYQCHGDAAPGGGLFIVYTADLWVLVLAYGQHYPSPSYDPNADFNRDLDIDFEDVNILKMWYAKMMVPGDCTETYLWRGVADDFRCLGNMPVTSIHWWGSYVGWDGSEPPAFAPTSWQIGFWSNIPDPDPGNPTTCSYPKELLWQIELPQERVQKEWIGYDDFPQRSWDSCFQYFVQLEPSEYFWQSNFEPNTIDDIFWLSIVAKYPQDQQVVYPWGWKTRPQHWMDDAVVIKLHDFEPQVGTVLDWCLCDGMTGGPDPCCVEPIMNESFEAYQSYDAAFELDTDPEYIKWEQPFTGIRNWAHYEDELSMATEDIPGEPNIARLVADDWLCRRRTPVTAVVWWGSYVGYQHQACYGPMATPLLQPDYFVLSIWTDVPPNPADPNSYSHPGRKIWEYKAYEYDEVMVGYDKKPHESSDPAREPVFRYSVRIPENDWFYQADVNGIYWLSIMAVHEPGPPVIFPWGWTNHPHSFSDSAVAGTCTGPDDFVWTELRDQESQIEDMSFVLFTEPVDCFDCADYNSDNIVNFLDYADFANDWNWSGPPGGYSNADLNCDGTADFYDLAVFVQQWLDNCP